MSNIKAFNKICKMSQKNLKASLKDKLVNAGYENVISEDGFIYAKGDVPILLTAHMDTVHKRQCTSIEIESGEDYTILSSVDGIGGDDRCGIYIILQVIKEYKPSILFCEDEEIGGIGSRKFCKTEYIEELKELKYLIELDRASSDDAVFYDCDNEDFTDYILENTKYKKAIGSFSDISELSPVCKVASVNLSCGYYKAHTTDEFVVFEEMEHTVDVVKDLLSKAKECEMFEYIEAENWRKFLFNGYSNNYFSSRYSYFDDTTEVHLYITYKDKDGKEGIGSASGNSEEEAWGNFFIKNSDICYGDVIDYDVFEY